ncbi:carboxypeptidase regulatory-like domain-containing protein [Pedobacter sp. LMG 31464]|uniref:Carboxypeptidase regulatory-like domain-containing protein n=1 Tax=Pedobacter planticolens TaxID=2679964 RepID=A0A923DX71_9SPHI|nr:carboxypeptidase regulatory-like domain-containing protein [Pedobacter planticolens]MBB2145684.1 carboxypeptidase regulatory-like domain-containing protein [Pedobacter planticolens]
MKFTRILFTLVAFTFVLNLSAFAQQDSIALNNIITKTKRLSDEQPVEKVYLHFDKPYYAVADTMWFKAYVTIEQNLPSPLSKIVYVEVWNAQDSLVQTVKLPIKNSVAYGNIPLNMQNYKQGNYYVRAYTLWMLNFSNDYFFTKTIVLGEAIDKQLITNISYSNEQSDKNLKTTAKIQFKDTAKKPYANKTVNWKVISNYDVVLRGKGTTDQNGILNVVVNSKTEEIITKGTIIADINIADKEVASASFNLKQTANNVDFQFFPEGGQLISGIPNQVGFKALKVSGLGVDAKGVIIDDQNNELTTFTSSYAGMGSFYITPESGKNYKAKVTFKDGTIKTYDLPKAAASGISLQVINSNAEFINLKILANTSFYEANTDKSFFVVAQNSSVIYYAAKANLKNQVIITKIPKKNFPSGIVQITLFNANNEPLSERLVFVLHTDAMNLAVKSDLPVYKPRQKVKMTLDAKSAGLPTAGDFSVSVIDEQKVPVDENNETTILSSLLLTSDLKGYIEKPNYYFTKTDEKKLADLDKLMLTQGYRRFTYKDILAGHYPAVTYLPEQGINITGTLRDRTGMPIKKGAMRLMVPGKPISSETVTSNMGLFNFQNLTFPDSSQVVVSAKYNANAANLMIMLDGIPTAGAAKNSNVADEVTNIDTVLSAYLSNSQKQYRYLRTLKTVEIKGAAVKKPSHADHGALSGLSSIPDHLITGDRLTTGCAQFLTCLKTMATGLTFDIDKFYISRDYNQGGRTPVQIFINGNPVDAIEVNSVNAAEVESVEIFLKDDLGTVDRMYGTKGVLVINTKKAPVGKKISKQELMDMLPKTNIITFNPMGYSKEREFYSPKYLPSVTYPNSDLRTTIYWNPKLITDDKGNVSFEFFNADGRGTYRAVVEGIDKNGNVGRAVYRYTVK